MTDKDEIVLDSDGVSAFYQEMAMPNETVIVASLKVEFNLSSLEFHGKCIDDIAGPAANFELIY